MKRILNLWNKQIPSKIPSTTLMTSGNLSWDSREPRPQHRLKSLAALLRLCVHAFSSEPYHLLQGQCQMPPIWSLLSSLFSHEIYFISHIAKASPSYRINLTSHFPASNCPWHSIVHRTVSCRPPCGCSVPYQPLRHQLEPFHKASRRLCRSLSTPALPWLHVSLQPCFPAWNIFLLLHLKAPTFSLKR